jgi:hypothetical protein
MEYVEMFNFNGLDYTVEAEMYEYGVFSMYENGEGNEEADIVSEPEWSDIRIWDDAGEVLEPDDVLAAKAIAILNDSYWRGVFG